MFTIQLERHAFIEMLEHESRKAVRRLRTFPLNALHDRHPECGMSAFELSGGFVSRLRRLEEIASGMRPAPPYAEARTLNGRLLEIELASASAVEALRAMPPFQWGELVACPADLASWSHARRGELLWLALRDLARHSRHFARHLGESREGGATCRVEDAPREPAGV